MDKTAESRELLTETMKELFPPRVELERRQYKMLGRLSAKTGKSVKELVQQALDRFLRDESSK